MNKIESLFSLKDRVIVVAGGAGQIGFAICDVLLEAGANVILADLDAEMASDKLSAKEWQGRRIRFMKVDVTDFESVCQFYQDVESACGGVDGLVNAFHYKGNTRELDPSAAFFSELASYPVSAWDAVHDVNLRGTFLMSQQAIPLLKKSEFGGIVNVSSTYGNVSPNPTIYGDSGINSPVAYASSKAGIINLTRYFAIHLAPFGIRANVLSPGGVYANQSEAFVEKYCEKTPLGRMATPHDYQGAVLFLLSEAASYMTGANLVVDGGWTAW